MRRSLIGHHLSGECLDACRLKLRAVLARLTSSRLHDGFNAVERVADLPVRDSTTEFALFCKRNLAANRSDWTGFLTRQVSEALERIDDGSYGLCLQCGQPIAAKRLAALPWVTFCITCEERKSENRVM